ncbi:MAG: ABC transporter permease subunit [Bacillota bacterium]
MDLNSKVSAKQRLNVAWVQIKNDRLFYLMLSPAIVYFLVFCYYPIIEARLAFEDFRFIGANQWVGLKHFYELFDSQAFIRVLINTLIISTMKIVFYFPVPIILSLLINELRTTWFRKYIQSVMYLPHFLSWVVIAGVFITILSPSSGAVAEIAKTMGLKPTAFLTDQSWIRWILVLTEMWRSSGWDTMLYVAALLAINPSLYEAAKIDGAGRVRQMLHITLPELKPTIIIVFILNLGFFMNAGFDQVFNLMNDSVISTIDILDTYVYRIGLLNGEVSYATAVGLFKGVIGLALIMASHFILKKKAGKGVW